VTTKNERAQNVQRRIDDAHAQSARRDHSDNVIARPDSDGGSADWPKRTRDVDAPAPKEQKP
jgi:hypothetical protein